MKPTPQLAGKRFGRLQVVAFHGYSEKPGHKSLWLTRCDCGNEPIIVGTQLTAGRTVSCGCRKRETLALGPLSQKRHGMDGTPEYYAWIDMKARCFRPTHKNYKDYGARGITVCDRWRDSCEAFVADMGLRPAPKLSLDRINNNGNYEPGNCRWATWSEQARNKRTRKNPDFGRARLRAT